MVKRYESRRNDPNNHEEGYLLVEIDSSLSEDQERVVGTFIPDDMVTADECFILCGFCAERLNQAIDRGNNPI